MAISQNQRVGPQVTMLLMVGCVLQLMSVVMTIVMAIMVLRTTMLFGSVMVRNDHGDDDACDDGGDVDDVDGAGRLGQRLRAFTEMSSFVCYCHGRASGRPVWFSTRVRRFMFGLGFAPCCR